MDEIWKPVKGFEKEYEVSTCGRIRSIARKQTIRNRWGGLVELKIKRKILRSKVLPNGYEYIILTKYPKRQLSRYVHRLVATTFIPNPGNKRCVNHKDSNRLNNNVENLEWNTHKENSRHAYNLGRVHKFEHYQGENHGSSKLTASQVLEVLEMLKDGMTAEQVSKVYKVSRGTIAHIKTGKSWNSVTGFPFTRKY